MTLLLIIIYLVGIVAIPILFGMFHKKIDFDEYVPHDWTGQVFTVLIWPAYLIILSVLGIFIVFSRGLLKLARFGEYLAAKHKS